MDFLKRADRNRSSSSRFRRAKGFSFGVLAVLAVVVAVMALIPRDDGRSEPPLDANTPEATAALVPNIDIIGDSYVAGSDQGGYGATNWTKVVGSRFYTESHPLDMNVIAYPGAGYIVRGSEKVNFAEAANNSLRSTADLVIVFGSRNDGKQEPAAMMAAAADLYKKIRERAPHAKLIAVGPVWVDEKVPDFIASDSQAISRAASNAGVEFVDPLREGWFFGTDAKLIGADGVHPTDAGHQFLAEKMRSVISNALAKDDS